MAALSFASRETLWRCIFPPFGFVFWQFSPRSISMQRPHPLLQNDSGHHASSNTDFALPTLALAIQSMRPGCPSSSAMIQKTFHVHSYIRNNFEVKRENWDTGNHCRLYSEPTPPTFLATNSLLHDQKKQTSQGSSTQTHEVAGRQSTKEASGRLFAVAQKT